MWSKVLVSWVCCFLLLEYTRCKPETDYHEAEQQILEQILDRYQRLSTPRTKDGGALKVNHSLNLNHYSLDTKNQLFSVEVVEAISWMDHRLAWNPDDYKAKVQKLFVDTDKIWIPDLTVFNEIKAPGWVYKPVAIVFNSGFVYYSPSMSYITPCRVSDHARAGDHVTCQLNIGSWVHDPSEVELVLTTDRMTLFFADQALFDRDWLFVDTNATKTEMTFEGIDWMLHVYNINLKRSNNVA